MSALNLRYHFNFTTYPSHFTIILPSLKPSWLEMDNTKINVSIFSMVFQSTHQEIKKLEKKGTEASIQISEAPYQ
jgi:hypothetical protein